MVFSDWLIRVALVQAMQRHERPYIGGSVEPIRLCNIEVSAGMLPLRASQVRYMCASFGSDW